MTPELTAVVVSYNTRDLLREALLSIRESDPACETFVVDNLSSDGTPAMLAAEFPWVRLIEPGRNLGFGAANNRALDQASGRHVLLLNPDARLLPGLLGRLLAVLDAHPDAAVCGPALQYPDGRFQSCGNPFPTFSRELRQSKRVARVAGADAEGPRRGDAPVAVDWVDGACMLVRRRAIETVGGFDEQYFLYGEEVDWQYRMRREGWTVLAVPDARVVHHLGQSSGAASPATLARLVDSRLRFYRTHHGLASALAVSALYAAGFVKQMVDGSARDDRAAGGGRPSAARVKLGAVTGWWRSLFTSQSSNR